MQRFQLALPALLVLFVSAELRAEPAPAKAHAQPTCFCKDRSVTVRQFESFFPSTMPHFPAAAMPSFAPSAMDLPVPHQPGQLPGVAETPSQGQDEDLPTPVVSIRVEAPAESAVGQDLEYRIFVANRSQAAAHHVVVRDRLPANARFVRANPEPSETQPELAWELGSLEPGARREIRLIIAPTGGGEIDNCVRVAFEHGVRLKTQLARAALRLQKIGPAEAQLYDALNYQLIVTNTGSAPLSNVLISDELPDGLEHRENRKQLTFSVDSLAPGQSRQFSYEVIAKRTGRLGNRAVATATGGLRDEVQSTVMVNEAALQLKMDAPREQSFGRAINYDLIVSNTGTAPLANVAVINRLPAKTAFVSASDNGRLVGSQIEWSLGNLPAGASKTIHLKLRPTGTGDIVNSAEATADRGLRVTADATTTVVGEAGLLFEVVDTEDPIEVGEDTQYNIIIRNQGSVPATNIRITATVPPQLAVTRVQGPSDHAREESKIVFQPLNLPPGKDTIYRVFVRGIKAGDARFRVELTSDQLTSGPLLEEESTNVFTPGQQEN
jgi:uncharacterized repeat protein (TIGR01451 family)